MKIKEDEGRIKHTEIILMGAHLLSYTEYVYIVYIHTEKLILVIRN